MERLYYLDVLLKYDHDIPCNFLLSKFMYAIHVTCALSVKLTGMSNIGVAFLDYDKEEARLGNKLRLFSFSEEVLKKIPQVKQFKNLEDYVLYGSVALVPEFVNEFVQYRRVQCKFNKEKLIRRYAKRHNEDLNFVRICYKDLQSKNLSLPYVNLSSSTSGEHFRLYIDQIENMEYIPPVFNSYGLISSGALPKF